eukprot:TRINITY_DN9453_c0_g8_i1.p1 TRINITY_DN9453_c0_g8~~TRINITY_DN9453_c0_g8_i1.p1  ORF type:complete len:380 (-),score=0.60 TRINITY_DN9453_c0_g8_i1:76-1215(-)
MHSGWKLLLLFIALQPAAQTDFCDPRVFDWRFYLWHSCDLQYASSYTTPEAACFHWSVAGYHEGRIGTVLFYTYQYCERNPGVPGCNETPRNYQAAIMYYLSNGDGERNGYLQEGAAHYLVIANNVIAIMVSRNFGGAISSIVYNGNVMLVNSGRAGTNFQVYAYAHRNNDTDTFLEGGVQGDWYTSCTTHTEIINLTTIHDSEIITQTRLKNHYTRANGFELKKNIKLNIDGNPNLFSYEIEIKMHESYRSLSVYVPYMNLVSEFKELYEVDVESRTYHALTVPHDNSTAYYAYKPIICAIPGVVAIGAVIKEIEGPKASAIYLYQARLDIGNELYERMMLIPHYYTGGRVPAGTKIKVKTHIAVGTVDEVVKILSRP